jgi:hydrogenase maturation protease
MTPASKRPRTLVAGVGNIFHGDDGFGVEVVSRLASRFASEDVDVVDFGIRALDLAYALLEDYAEVILVDATPRGGAPGTVYLIEPGIDELEVPGAGLAGHALAPTQVLALARSLGGPAGTVRLVGCEPGPMPAADELQVGLSAPVSAAVEDAVRLVEQLLEVPGA